MTIARQFNGIANASPASSITVTWPSGSTRAGSLLILDVSVNGGIDVNAHVPAGWVLVGSRVDHLTNLSIWTYAKPNAPATSASVTVNFVLSSDDSTATSRYGAVMLSEYPGLAITGYIDVTAQASGGNQSIDTGATGATTVASDIAHCFASHANDGGAAGLGTNTTSYTALVTRSSGSAGTDRVTAGLYEKQLAGVGSTFQFTCPITGGINRAWCVSAVALAPVSTSPVTPGVPPAQGLYRAGATSLQSDRLPPVMNGITYYPDWRNLEASNTGALNGSDVAVIDGLITYCNANGIQLKLRPFVNGNNAPGGLSSCPPWLTTLCGTFKHANSQLPNSPEVMTKFWVQPFLDHFDRLQQLMSARWDSHPELVDVTISNAMMKYAEPLIRDPNIPANRAELVGGGNGFAGTFIATPGAGYTDTKNIAAIKAGMDSHAAYWPNTCSSFAYNPYESITSYSVFDVNDDATLSQTRALMSYHRQALGARAVLENNSVRDSFFTFDGSGNANGIASGPYGLMYTAMVALGAPLFFQTATRNPNRVGDLSRTMDGIINVLGGNAVEPPPDYETDATSGAADASDFSVASFTTYNAALIANPTGAGQGVMEFITLSDGCTGSDTLTETATTTGLVSISLADTATGTDSVTATDLTTATNPTKHRPAKRS